MKKIGLIIITVFVSLTMFSQEGFRYKVKSLDGVNTELSDFGTSFYGDKIIYATTSNRVSSDRWRGNNQPFLEIYIGDIATNGEIINEINFSKRINTKYHESNAVFTKDLKRVYFSRNNFIHGMYKESKEGINLIQMYTAEVNKKGKWSKIKPMPFNSNEYQTGHPALNADQTKLYFTSDMPGSIGKTDIWMVAILEDGKYGEPVNLGSEVNSLAKEMFPFITPSNKLYFSSNKSGGIGGLDVYVSDLIGENASNTTLLKEPINSLSDDFSFIINEATGTGYFSSRRLGGKGDDDIYFFKRTQEDCKQVAEGIVIDNSSRRIIPGATVVLYDDEGTELDRMIVGYDAKFSFEIDCKSPYKVIGSKQSYTENSKEFVSNAKLELGLYLDLSLKPNPFIDTAVTVNYDRCQEALDMVNNIYFDIDKSYIRPDAASELDKVVRIMKRCDGIQVEASSHTDSRAPRDYNQRLSQRRAQATINYIMRRGGFTHNRIRAVGYGEERLKNHCSDNVRCTEEEHQVNRRTEFKIKNW